MKYTIEVRYQPEDREYWGYVNGEAEAFAASATECARRCEEYVARMKRQEAQLAEAAAALRLDSVTRQSYRELQCEMFGAWSEAGLTRDRDEMIALINAMLGTDYTSRTQFDEREMKLIASAARGGFFDESAPRTLRLAA